MSTKGSVFGKLAAAVLAVLFVAPDGASAVPIQLNASVRSGAFRTWAMDGIDRSWDGNNAIDFMTAFSPYVAADFLQLGSFSGPLSLSGSLVLEIAGWANSNDFGFVDANNNFTTLVDGSATPGASYELANVPEGTFTFALNTNAGLWRSIDSLNSDYDSKLGAGSHIVGQRVIQNAALVVNGLTFNLQVGDYVLYMEDLSGRTSTDNDFNDSVVIVRTASSTEIPEPATMLLLGSGLAGLAIRRRKAKTA